MLLFMDGFDHYATADITKKWTSNSGGGLGIVGGAGRRGTSGFQVISSSSYVNKTIPPTTSLIFGFSIKLGSLPSTSTLLLTLFDGSTQQCELRVNADGTLQVLRAANTLTNGASTLALSTGVEYYIEWKVTIADSIAANSCKVRVNGVDWINVAAGQDTKAGTNATVNSVRLGAFGTGIGTTTFDDFYICDNSGSTNNDFLGDVRIDTLFPSGDGNYSQFTPSTGTTHYTLVDESTPNTTDYNDGASVGDRDSYAMGNLSALASSTVYGVQVNAAIVKDDAGSKSATTFVRSSSTNADGASVALSTSQAYVSQVFETDPNGSVAWTETTVNAMEAGVKVTA